MKLRGSLACLLLALCLGRGAASPLQSGGEGTGSSAAEGVGDAIGEAVGEGAKEAASSGIQNALGQGHGEEGGYAVRGARGDAFDHRLGEAARSLGNAGDEVRRQAEDVVRRGMDAAHNSGSWVSGWEAGCAGRGKNSRNGSRVKRWFLGGCLGLLLWLSCISSPLPPPTPGWCRLPLSLMIARDGHTKDGCIVLSGDVWRPWNVWLSRWCWRPRQSRWSRDPLGLRRQLWNQLSGWLCGSGW